MKSQAECTLEYIRDLCWEAMKTEEEDVLSVWRRIFHLADGTLEGFEGSSDGKNGG